MAVGNWAVYWPKIKAMQVTLRPVGHQTVMVCALVLAVLAAFNQPGIIGGGLAGFTIPVAGMFLFFTLNSGMPHKPLPVRVGQPMPRFAATAANGGVFDSAQLEGKPYLLKFFRGHW